MKVLFLFIAIVTATNKVILRILKELYLGLIVCEIKDCCLKDPIIIKYSNIYNNNI